MYRIAICDDNADIIHSMRELINEYLEEDCVIDTYDSGLDVVREYKAYAILFLDIDIGDITGIELAGMIRKRDRDALIVFITNYTQYYRPAFAVHAFDYLVKPITRERLFKVMDEIREYKKEETGTVCFRGEAGIIQFKIRDIFYFEYVERKVKVVTSDREFLLCHTMSEIKARMDENEFTAPHRAFLISLGKVVSIKGYDIVMENGDYIPLAQKKAAAFKKNFSQYLYKKAEKSGGSIMGV